MEKDELVSAFKSMGFNAVLDDDGKIRVDAKGGTVTIVRCAAEYIAQCGAISVIFTRIIDRFEGEASLVDYCGVMVAKIFKPE